MKEKGKSLFILVLLIGVILIVGSYYAVFSPYKKKAADLQGEIDVVQRRVDTLEVYKRNEATYRSDIEKYLNEVAEVLEMYPADVRYEDAIMEAVAMQENNQQFKFNTITIGDKEELFTVSDEIINKMNRSEYISAVGFERTEALYATEVGYEDLKNALTQVLEKDNRVSISDISYAKAGVWKTVVSDDGITFYLLKEDPLLAGSLSLDFYSVFGTDKVYEAPDMEEYESGISNIFGVIELEIDEETGLPIDNAQ